MLLADVVLKDTWELYDLIGDRLMISLLAGRSWLSCCSWYSSCWSERHNLRV